MTTDDTLRDNLVHRVNVGDSLTRTAARYPHRTAMVEAGRQVTYAQFDAAVNALANRLTATGYVNGDALALASGNSIDFLTVYYACAKLGVVCVPVNLGWRPDEVHYVLEHSGARGIVVESQLVAPLAEAFTTAAPVRDVVVADGTGADWRSAAGADASWPTLAEFVGDAPATTPEVFVGDRDPITYLYTSGTTAAPKGVVGNHTAIYVESMTMAIEAQLRDTDRIVAMLPMFHTAQLNCFCTPAVLLGATLYIERAFDAGRLLDLIPAEQITHVFGLPMMYGAMLDHPAIETADLSSLRRACYAMAPMPDAQLDRLLARFGCEFFLLFGQTEMSPTATIFRPEHQTSHRGAVGTPAVSVQVAIMDADGALLPAGGSGEIVYRGPHTMTSYLRNPEATATAFEHGWFHSGDIGHFGDDGVLWFSDRRKDVIKTGGENVASIEVERAVYAADPGVAEVVVVGLPHDHWSEAITAVVVPRPGAEIDEARLIAGVKERIDPYKAPKAVVVVDALPRTSTGKVQKNVVRAEHAELYRLRE